MNKDFIKKMGTGLFAVGLVVSVFSIDAAALGSVGGYMLNSSTARAVIFNDSGIARYCDIYLRQGRNVNVLTTVNQHGELVQNNSETYVDGNITADHAYAEGYIYNSGSPNSGVAGNGFYQIW